MFGGQIVKAYHQGPLRKANASARDILVQFSNWEMKNKVQGILCSQPGLNMDSSEVSCCSDLNP